MPVKNYELVVIGAGSGLDVAVAAAKQYGWKVALVEKGPLGGTCLNRGCIPSKMIIHAADVATNIRQAQKFGIQATIAQIDLAAITTRANQHVDREAERIETNLRQSKMLDLYKGVAEFKNSRTLRIKPHGKSTQSQEVTEISAERFLIAAGARPFIPPIKGLEQIHYWTSTEALRQTKQPESLIIIGGGYIAAELGHFYGALGTKVTIIQRGSRLLTHEDKEIAEKFTQVFSKKYQVLLNTQPLSVSENAQGIKSVVVTNREDNRQTLEAEALLIATGRQPNSDLLKVQNAAVKVDSRGYIITDAYLETSTPKIWALGDIVGKAPFKHGANYEAQRVFWNLAGQKKYALDYTIMPHAIFSNPQVAAVGLTEEQAISKGLGIRVARLPFINTAMGKALAEQDGFVKFILDSNREKILGAHIIGPEAAILIHEVVVAMSAAGARVSAIKNSIHIHPALAEVLQKAL